MTKALLLIDVQNDYFPEGKYPLWNTDATVSHIHSQIAYFQENSWPIIHIQHVAEGELAPFFLKDSRGAEIESSVLEAASTAPVVVKHWADSFHETDLDHILQEHQVTEIYLAGMMTQNCVTHTALSKSAEKYTVKVLSNCCTTVDQMLHLIALHALSSRVEIL